jgi:hypothetical protein
MVQSGEEDILASSHSNQASTNVRLPVLMWNIRCCRWFMILLFLSLMYGCRNSRDALSIRYFEAKDYTAALSLVGELLKEVSESESNSTRKTCLKTF